MEWTYGVAIESFAALLCQKAQHHGSDANGLPGPPGSGPDQPAGSGAELGEPSDSESHSGALTQAGPQPGSLAAEPDSEFRPPRLSRIHTVAACRSLAAARSPTVSLAGRPSSEAAEARAALAVWRSASECGGPVRLAGAGARRARASGPHPKYGLPAFGPAGFHRACLSLRSSAWPMACRRPAKPESLARPAVEQSH